MAKEQSQTAKLKKTKECKHSVRFDSEEANPKVVSSVYLLNPAYEALEKPDEIEVTVKSPGAKG